MVFFFYAKMTREQFEFVMRCIEDQDMHRFYTWSVWKRKRAEALQLFRYECQDCKARGRYTRATHVHHVRHLKDYPQYALDLFVTDAMGQRQVQLLPLCEVCHDRRHPERLKGHQPKKFLTEERW